MRFRIRLEMTIAAGGLDEALAALNRAEGAAFDALGPALVADGRTGALMGHALTPEDEAAAAAFAADDLGPGISGVRRSVDVPPDHAA